MAKRLCPAGKKGMSKLVKDKILPDLDQVSLKKCEACLDGKQNKVSFHSSPPSRMENVLDLVHSEVCGPLSKSLGRAKYFVTFIDDHSRKTQAYTIKSKD